MVAGWTGTRELVSHFSFSGDEGQSMNCFTRESGPASYTVMLDDETHTVSFIFQDDSSARLAIDNVQQSVHYAFLGKGEVAVQIRGQAQVLTNQLAFTKGDEEAGGSGAVTAPMHGNMLEIMVAVGERVEPGQGLAIMEAMKMEHRLKAQIAGEVVAIHATAGSQVAAGAVVLEIAADEEA